MASEPASAGRYTAIEIDDSQEHILGNVVLDAAGMINVEPSADGADNEGLLTLARIAERMNAKPVMHVDTPPPPGSPRFALATRSVKRDNSAFIPALKDYLRTYYNIELRPR